MGLLLFIVIGVLSGWLAGRFMRGNGFGLIGDVIVGIGGAFAGGYVFAAVGAELGGGWIAGLIVAFAGAVLSLFIVRLFTGRRDGRRIWS